MTTIPPDNFRHVTDIAVRWGDMDALGHVNNATYLTYLEQARITYVDHLDVWDGKVGELGLIMARVVLDYKLPVTAKDRVTVYSRTSRLGNKSFDIEQVVMRHNGDQSDIAATATVTVVVFDYSGNQTVPIPDSWRARMIDYEPGVIK